MEAATLAHHGVKGMKWGVRKNRRSSGGGVLGRLAKRKANPNVGMVDTLYKPQKRNANPNVGMVDTLHKPQKPKVDLAVDPHAAKPKESPTAGLIRGKKTAAISDKQLKATIERIKMDAEYSKLTRSGFQKFMSRIGDKLSAEAAGVAAGLVSKAARQYLDLAMAQARAGKSGMPSSPKSRPSGSPPSASPNLPAAPKPPKPSGGSGGWFQHRWARMASEFKRTYNGPTATTRDTANKIYDQYGDHMFERGSVIDENGRSVKPRKR